MASSPFAVAGRRVARLFRAGSVAGFTDGELLDRFVVRRDGEAFGAIIARHGPLVLRVCRSILRDPNDVDDVFQATFLVLVRKAGGLRDRERLGNWLYGVALRGARRARDEASRRGPGRPETGQEPAVLDPEPSDLRALILDEVGRLPATYRDAVLLCYFDGRTHEEAARDLGWPVGTVRGRLARARKILRGRLVRRGIAPGSAALAATLGREAGAAVSPSLLDQTVALASAASGRLPLADLVATGRAVALAHGASQAMNLAIPKAAAALLVVVGLITAPAISAIQGGGRVSAPAAKSAAPAAGASVAGAKARERVELAKRIVTDIRKLAERGEVMFSSPEFFDWNRRLLDARLDAGEPREIAIQSYIDTARADEAVIERKFRAGESTQTELDIARYRRADAEAMLDAPPTAPTPPPPSPRAGAEERLKIAEEGLAEVRRELGDLPTNSTSKGQKAALVQVWARRVRDARIELYGPEQSEFDPSKDLEKLKAFEAVAKSRLDRQIGEKSIYLNARYLRLAAEESLAVKERAERPDRARNRAIEAKLEQVVPMNFPEDTPLSTVLALIREKTKDPSTGKTIPIYVNPTGLQEVEKTMASPINLAIEDVPLRITLRILLGQLQLGYRVERGMLYIDNVGDLNPPDGEQPRPVPTPSDVLRNEAIQAALETPLPMRFHPHGSLKDVMAFLHQRLKTADGRPIPIYVDPVGLQEAEKTIDSPISLELEDVPVRTTLSLILNQIGMRYEVVDGLIRIDAIRVDPEDAAEPAHNLGMGGGVPMGGFQ